MKQRRRLGIKKMIGGLCICIVGMLAVGTTAAYLWDKSDPVINTFAGGSISIYIDEAKVDDDGKAITGDDAERVLGNNYKYMAGAIWDKDPTPSVVKGSDSCYVFLCLENPLPAEKFEINIDTEKWVEVEKEGEKILYMYCDTVDASEADKDMGLAPLFTKIKVSAELTSEDVKALGEKQIKVTAFAIQTDAINEDTAKNEALKQFQMNE